jgi:hypothetical protein
MSIRSLILALATGCTLSAATPTYVRIWTQYVEVPHSNLNGWLNGGRQSGNQIHAEAVKLAKEGGARIIETNMVVCRCGQKAAIESIGEEIYPTDYEPPQLPGSFSGPSAGFPVSNTLPELRPNTPSAFETRNTGVTLEVEPTIGDNDSIIDLRLASEIVTLLRLETWMEHVDQWGDASFRMPVFETWRSNTALSLIAGRFELASVITPIAKAPSPLIPKRILLFVRADLVPLPLTEP